MVFSKNVENHLISRLISSQSLISWSEKLETHKLSKYSVTISLRNKLQHHPTTVITQTIGPRNHQTILPQNSTNEEADKTKSTNSHNPEMCFGFGGSRRRPAYCAPSYGPRPVVVEKRHYYGGHRGHCGPPRGYGYGRPMMGGGGGGFGMGRRRC